MTEYGNPSSNTEREWEYEIGDIVAKESEPTMAGAGPDIPDNRTEYEVRKRLKGADDDGRYYYLKYEDGNLNMNQLYDEKVLRLRFEKVGEFDGRYVDTESDRSEADIDE